MTNKTSLGKKQERRAWNQQTELTNTIDRQVTSEGRDDVRVESRKVRTNNERTPEECESDMKQSQRSEEHGEANICIHTKSCPSMLEQRLTESSL